jgi:hypothetical protein
VRESGRDAYTLVFAHPLLGRNVALCRHRRDVHPAFNAGAILSACTSLCGHAGLLRPPCRLADLHPITRSLRFACWMDLHHCLFFAVVVHDGREIYTLVPLPKLPTIILSSHIPRPLVAYLEDRQGACPGCAIESPAKRGYRKLQPNLPITPTLRALRDREASASVFVIWGVAISIF